MVMVIVMVVVVMMMMMMVVLTKGAFKRHAICAESVKAAYGAG